MSQHVPTGRGTVCRGLLLLLLVGCGNKTDDAIASAGQHDSYSDAGADGMQSTEAAVSPCALPACLSTLARACARPTACSTETAADSGIGVPETVTTVQGSDGGTCYTLEDFLGNAGESRHFAWRDGDGTTIATGARSSSMGDRFDVSCADGSGPFGTQAGSACTPADMQTFVLPTCDRLTTSDDASAPGAG